VNVYADCPCGGVYEHEEVSIKFEVGGKTVMLSQVPQTRCSGCGARVYQAATLERIETAYKGRGDAP
jgi:YgiT-type zinc finger domain-containing protein